MCGVKIDKSTGRGCAWGIASKTIVRRLVDEGIIGKEIARKSLKYRCDSIRVTAVGTGVDDVYVVLRKDARPMEQPLWTPTFIDPVKWLRAVSQFRPGAKLAENAEKYLLPEMGEYLQSLSDSELVSMVRDFLLEHGVLHAPIRQEHGKTFYFNAEEVYTLDRKSELFPSEGRLKFNLFKVLDTSFSMAVWRKAAARFAPGMSLRECIGVFLETKIEIRPPREPSPLEQLVQQILPPVFEREPENENTSTFDRIRITVGLPRYQFPSWEALRSEVKRHRREIYRLVLDKIEKDRRFKRFGVPVNVLKLSDVTLLRNYSLEFILELKEETELAQEPQN